LAARVLRSWTEDFVDEDTGEVVTIERNEIILERDVVLDEENIEAHLEAETEDVILQKEEVEGLLYHLQYLQKDPSSSEMEAVQYIYRQLARYRSTG
jgi:DNA-directed RNA polymerase subunit beta